MGRAAAVIPAGTTASQTGAAGGGAMGAGRTRGAAADRSSRGCWGPEGERVTGREREARGSPAFGPSRRVGDDPLTKTRTVPATGQLGEQIAPFL